MLHRYRFSNLYSFRESTEVDLRLNLREPESDWWAKDADDQRIAKVMAVIGPNGSGKTSLLNALVFLHWFMLMSFTNNQPGKPLPFSPHALTENEPTELEVEFVADLDGERKLWKYELRLTSEMVLSEVLHVKRKRWSVVFERIWDSATASYAVKGDDFDQLPKTTVNDRKNASLISIGIQHGLPVAKGFAQVQFRSNIVALGKEWSDLSQLQRATNFFFDNPQHQETLGNLLSAWDLGLSEVQLREYNETDGDGKTVPRRLALGVHRGRDQQQYQLSFIRESRGTQAAFVLLSRLIPVLQEGGMAVIDEFESDLHPHMLAPILDLFASPTTNPHHAQLLFTSHSMEVLNLLPKSQVILVEKDEFNESQAWRLDEVKGIRSDDNFYAKYMAGAYGAVPRL
ncbi:MAG: ATP-binding protein [Burkholderiales bacterium]|nr:MAG: ATP-binding protein [Burkholderiales bacterium]